MRAGTIICIAFCAAAVAAQDARVAQAAKQLQSGFPEIRAQGIVTLGELGAKGYSKQIASLVRSDPDFQVRYYGVQALGMLEAKEHAPIIADMLKDRVQAQVRVRAAEVLGRFAAKGFDPEIAKLLKHTDPMVRGRIAHAMGAAGAKEYAKDIAPLTKDLLRCTLYDNNTREFRIKTTVGEIATNVLTDWGIAPPK